MRKWWGHEVKWLFGLAAVMLAFQNCTKSEFSSDSTEPTKSSPEILDNGYPYSGKPYVDKDVGCGGNEIKTKIMYYSATSAQLLTSQCLPVDPPQNLAANSFQIDPQNSDVLIHQARTLVAELPTRPAVPTVNLASPSGLIGSAGAPVTITYNFLAEPMASDHTVFVNFVNTGGTSVFFDNHQPTPPTSSWSGPLGYSRTVAIPAGTPPGLYKIVVGTYENPSPGVYINQSMLTGSGVTVDGAPGNFLIGTLQVQ